MTSQDDCDLYYEATEPLVLYVQKTWQVTAASWADADSREPAAIVARLLTGKLLSWHLNDACDAFWSRHSGLAGFGPACVRAGPRGDLPHLVRGAPEPGGAHHDLRRTIPARPSRFRPEADSPRNQDATITSALTFEATS